MKKNELSDVFQKYNIRIGKPFLLEQYRGTDIERNIMKQALTDALKEIQSYISANYIEKNTIKNIVKEFVKDKNDVDEVLRNIEIN